MNVAWVKGSPVYMKYIANVPREDRYLIKGPRTPIKPGGYSDGSWKNTVEKWKNDLYKWEKLFDGKMKARHEGMNEKNGQNLEDSSTVNVNFEPTKGSPDSLKDIVNASGDAKGR